MSCSSTRAFAPLSHSRLCENGNTLNSGFPMRIQNGVHCQNKKITTGRFHFGVKFPLFKGGDRPQWKVIEWRRRRSIIVDEMCPAYSDRAEIGSLKVQPQFSIKLTTFPEELILSVLLGVSNFFPIKKETIYLLCGNDFCNLILFYFIYLFIFLGRKIQDCCCLGDFVTETIDWVI